MLLLQASNLIKTFTLSRYDGFRHLHEVIRAVDDVSFSISSSETLGLVGESGCGKSTLARSIIRLIEPTSGDIIFDGINLRDLSGEKMRQRRKSIQMVFQDPFGSLNPRMRVGEMIAEPLLVHNIVPKNQSAQEVLRLLNLVGLAPDAGSRYPHEFSGGQRQRIGIARALASRPKLIIADEPVSALDISIRAQILNLFRSLQEETGISYLFVAHDLGAVRQISHRVAVMYMGRFVEMADSDQLFDNPRHPYTRSLLAAAPSSWQKSGQDKLSDEIPSPIAMPSGCRYRTRCPHSQTICSTDDPSLKPFENGMEGHLSACHFASQLPHLS